MKTLDELRSLYEAMPIDRLRDAVSDGEASYRPEAWQIIQEEVLRRREDGRWPPEDDPGPTDTPPVVSRTEEENLTGVRGWLAFFVVIVALGLFASTIQAFTLIASDQAGVTTLLQLLWIPAISYGLHLIFSRDVRAPRYWILLMVAQASFGVAVAAIDGEVRDAARSVLASIVWGMYWANSRRVRCTFAPSPVLVPPVPSGGGDTTIETDAAAPVDPPAAEPSTSGVAAQATHHVLSARTRQWVAVAVAGLALLAVFLVVMLANRADGPSDGQAPASAATQPLTPREIAERARAATVQIRALDARGDVIGQGTGFFLSTQGLIGTNLHVIRRAHALQVETLSGDTYDLVFYVTADARRDLAILKIPVDDARPLPLALDSAIAVGERLYVMGNPLGQTGTFSDGLVSANRTVDGVSLLQMTAPVSPGSSGGPVLNARAEVIGMATLMLREGQNLNYAVPVRYIRPLLGTGEPPRRYAVDLLPRVAGGLSSIGSTDRSSGAGSPRESRERVAPRLDDVVGTQFVAADSSMQSVGGELASPIRRGSLEGGGTNSHDVVLSQSRKYAIVGLCDEDCSDLDLTVSTPAGTPLASDVQPDDKPYLLFTAPASGTYRLKVTMASCRAAPCAYGVRLYRF
jgi:hypothetical protein